MPNSSFCTDRSQHEDVISGIQQTLLFHKSPEKTKCTLLYSTYLCSTVSIRIYPMEGRSGGLCACIILYVSIMAWNIV